MSAPPEDRATTPMPQTPTQMLTPKTPERRIDISKQVAASPAFEGTDWETFSKEHIMALSADSARHSLELATQKIRALERECRQHRVKASHYRFNYEMLLSEQEERTMRAEVEHHLVYSSQELLCQKLNQSVNDEQTFRTRHIKAKRRAAELLEDTKRQQLSIEHLKQALSAQRPFLQTGLGHGANRRRDGGLDVLSDAAGLAQLRDQDQSSGNDSPRPQSGPLLSPVAFESDDGQRGAALPLKKRKLLQDTDDREENHLGDIGFIQQPVGKRLTFNSSGNTMDSSRRQIAPITPKSPSRAKLQASAMS